jgi:hypothetical protein
MPNGELGVRTQLDIKLTFLLSTCSLFSLPTDFVTIGRFEQSPTRLEQTQFVGILVDFDYFCPLYINYNN